MTLSSNISHQIVRCPMDADLSVRTLGIVQYNTQWKHFPRTINEYILYFIVSGDMYIEEDGVPYHIQKGEYFLLEPNKLHVGYQSAPVAYYYVHFSSSKEMPTVPYSERLQEHIHRFRSKLLADEWDCMLQRSPSDQQDLHFPKHWSYTSAYDYLLSLKEINRVFYEGLEGRRRIVSLRLMEMLVTLCRDYSNYCTSSNQTAFQILVRKIRLYINDHYSEAITGETIAAVFSLNYDYLNRLFKKYVGQTIHSYLLSVRINKAQELIASGSKICVVAQAVGFDDPAYFSRMFKRATGLSPSEYSKHLAHNSRK